MMCADCPPMSLDIEPLARTLLSILRVQMGGWVLDLGSRNTPWNHWVGVRQGTLRVGNWGHWGVLWRVVDLGLRVSQLLGWHREVLLVTHGN